MKKKSRKVRSNSNLQKKEKKKKKKKEKKNRNFILTRPNRELLGAVIGIGDGDGGGGGDFDGGRRVLLRELSDRQGLESMSS